MAGPHNIVSCRSLGKKKKNHIISSKPCADCSMVNYASIKKKEKKKQSSKETWSRP